MTCSSSQRWSVYGVDLAWASARARAPRIASTWDLAPGKSTPAHLQEIVVHFSRDSSHGAGTEGSFELINPLLSSQVA